MRSLRSLFVVLLAILLTVTACGQEERPEAETEGTDTDEKGEITIGLNNWAENVAVSNMWKLLLEENGYNVTLDQAEKAPVWVGTSRGDIDIAPEVWLPTTDAPLYEEYEENIEMHEPWYEGTGLGIVVPEYMDDIESIDEINEKKDEFGLDEIVGIDAGASLMQLTDQAIEEYGLDIRLIDSSEPAMLTELDKAYNDEDPIFVTLWNPHWVFADYDLKYLEDPKNVYGEPDDIHYMTRTGFAEDYPEVVEWMDKWEMDDDSLGQLMAVINDVGDPAEGAQQWIDDNRDLVDQWFE